MVLMNRLGTREIVVSAEDILEVIINHPDAHLSHSYDRIADQLTIKLEGTENSVVN